MFLPNYYGRSGCVKVIDYIAFVLCFFRHARTVRTLSFHAFASVTAGLSRVVPTSADYCWPEAVSGRLVFGSPC